MNPSTGSRIDVAPRWTIVPQGRETEGDRLPLFIDPGAGFGDGTHETTQLCLQAIASLAPRSRSWRMLDFGSGSGILSVAAARLGATVDAVEIDARAAAHGRRTAGANGVSDRIHHVRRLEETQAPFDLVAANILLSVLVEASDALVARLSPAATLILSGLVSTDVPAISARYAPLLGGARPEIYERGDWRTVVWRQVARPPGDRR